MKWACSRPTPPASICPLLVLFTLKERRQAFWHFNNLALPINCPWPGWEMPTLLEEWVGKCHTLPTHLTQDKITHVRVLSPPLPPPSSLTPPLCPLRFVRHRGLWWGGLLTNSWCFFFWWWGSGISRWALSSPQRQKASTATCFSSFSSHPCPLPISTSFKWWK